MHLNMLMSRLEQAFGPVPRFAGRDLSSNERKTLATFFGESGYKLYLQDQTNRQVIRDYLANALFHGHISESELPDIEHQLGSAEGRQNLALLMVVKSIGEAADLVNAARDGDLIPLEPGPDSPPNIHLVDNNSSKNK